MLIAPGDREGLIVAILEAREHPRRPAGDPLAEWASIAARHLNLYEMSFEN
jgi:hypothetical protein